MTAALGRLFRFTAVGGAGFAGLRSKSVTINGEPINISDDDSDGWQTFLAGSADDVPVKGVTISASGVTKDAVLINKVMEGGGVAKLTNWELEDEALSVSWTGNWVVYGLQLGNEHEDAKSFTVTIASDGEVTYDTDSTD